MTQENQPIVVVARWTAGPSCRAAVGDGLSDISRPQIAKLLRDVRTGADLAARATSGIEQLFLDKKAAPRGAEVTASDADDTADERFPHERECQKIVLAFAKKYFGHDHLNRPRFTIPRLLDLTERHGCRVGRDTIRIILEESDPRSGCPRYQSNRDKSYYKLIYAFTHEFCVDDNAQLSPKTAEKIASIVRAQGDTIEVEVIGKILKDTDRAVKRNW